MPEKDNITHPKIFKTSCSVLPALILVANSSMGKTQHTNLTERGECLEYNVGIINRFSRHLNSSVKPEALFRKPKKSKQLKLSAQK